MKIRGEGEGAIYAATGRLFTRSGLGVAILISRFSAQILNMKTVILFSPRRWWIADEVGYADTTGHFRRRRSAAYSPTAAGNLIHFGFRLSFRKMIKVFL